MGNICDSHCWSSKFWWPVKGTELDSRHGRVCYGSAQSAGRLYQQTRTMHTCPTAPHSLLPLPPLPTQFPPVLSTPQCVLSSLTSAISHITFGFKYPKNHEHTLNQTHFKSNSIRIKATNKCDRTLKLFHIKNDWFYYSYCLNEKTTKGSLKQRNILLWHQTLNPQITNTKKLVIWYDTETSLLIVCSNSHL